MEGFITFLLFFFLFMWLMKRLFPLILAWFIKKKLKQAGQDAYSGTNEHKKEEGKVVITDIPKQEKVIDKEIGEYVDFEEQ